MKILSLNRVRERAMDYIQRYPDPSLNPSKEMLGEAVFDIMWPHYPSSSPTTFCRGSVSMDAIELALNQEGANNAGMA